MIRPHKIVLKSGVHLSVSQRRPTASITLYAPPSHRDPHVPASGLGAFQTWFEPGDGNAEFTGMPVEIVRAYCKLHGGVAQAGEEALALLKSLPEQAAPAAVAPSTDSRPPAVPAADPDDPLPPACRPIDRPPHVQLDFLTQAILDARGIIREHEGPLLLRGRPCEHHVDERQAWVFRVVGARGVGRRFVVTTDPKLASHPLLQEALALKGRLEELADYAWQQAEACDEMRVVRTA